MANSPFSMMHNDRITITRPDGTLVGENIAADVQAGKKSKIFTEAVHLPIQPGDIVSRTLPSGVVERFIVEDPGYHAGIVPGLPADYQMDVRREDAKPRPAPVQYNVSGQNARINIASLDASHNVVKGGTDELFKALTQALRVIADPDERDRVLAQVQALESEVGKPSFAERYQRFVASAAAHIEIIAPFIVPLTALMHH